MTTSQLHKADIVESKEVTQGKPGNYTMYNNTNIIAFLEIYTLISLEIISSVNAVNTGKHVMVR